MNHTADNKPYENVLESTFLNNAFLFFRNAHRILSDKKMSFVSVPFRNDMGLLHLKDPVLGVFIEWWLNSYADITKDAEGKDALTYKLVGSPCTGYNRCTCVYPDGHTEKLQLSSFSAALGSFINIHKRYAQEEVTEDVYSLEEVVRILSQNETEREAELAIQQIKEERERNLIEKCCDRLRDEYHSLEDRYYKLALHSFKAELEEFRDEYLSRKEKVTCEVNALIEQRKELKSRMKQGLISNVEYQHLFMPLHKKKGILEFELTRFRMAKTLELTKSGYITNGIVNRFLAEDPRRESDVD